MDAPDGRPPGAVLSRDTTVEAERIQVAIWRRDVDSRARAGDHRGMSGGGPVRDRSNVNLIHHASGVKIDLFIAGSPLEARQLERRRRAQVGWGPDRFVYVHSPEDIVLQKLEWFRSGA